MSRSGAAQEGDESRNRAATRSMIANGGMPHVRCKYSEKSAGTFTKGQSGNPAGKPKGARHRATLAAEALLDGEAEALTRKGIELALEGNIFALKICLDRILPART